MFSICYEFGTVLLVHFSIICPSEILFLNGRGEGKYLKCSHFNFLKLFKALSKLETITDFASSAVTHISNMSVSLSKQFIS